MKPHLCDGRYGGRFDVYHRRPHRFLRPNKWRYLGLCFCDTVYERCLHQAHHNITGAFAESNLLLWSSVRRLWCRQPCDIQERRSNSYIMPLGNDSVLLCSSTGSFQSLPFAVLSLIASAVGGQEILSTHSPMLDISFLASCWHGNAVPGCASSSIIW
jgi:hypothetical protein